MVGVTVEEIQEEFSDLDLDITDDEVLFKLKEFCDFYNIDANKISCEYFSFNTKSKTNTGKPPTLETLGQFEAEKLKHLRGHARRPLDPIEGAENLPDCAEVGTPTRLSAAGAKRNLTPDGQINKRFVTALGSPAVFSPSSQVSSSSQSCKYSDRKNRGDIVLSHNKELPGSWTPSPGPAVVNTDAVTLTGPYKYMFESSRERAAVLDETICRIGDLLAERFGFGEPMDVRLTAVEPQVAVGRICCDSEGHLNSNSVVLQCSMDSSGGHTIPLDLSRLESFSLFPGQIVAVECTNPNGSKLLVTKLYSEVPISAPEPVETEQVQELLVCCGPFTPNESESTQPLQDILAVIAETQPHVAFLLGPFVDAKNRAVDQSCVAHQQTFDTMLKEVYAAVEDLRTTVVLVPALRDAHENFVYPQPPYNIGDPSLWNGKIISLPDPALVTINGVSVGVTSSDILFHLGREEISYPPRSGDRLSRLAGHLLSQRSFYPLYPPAGDQNVDYEHQEQHAQLPAPAPALLLLPSDLVYFVRQLDAATVLNPGRVTKGAGAGTYARVLVRTEQGKVEIKADIVRI